MRIFMIGVLLVGPYAAPLAAAGGFCDTFAKTSVKQSQAYFEHGCTTGEANWWSVDYDYHYRWCAHRLEHPQDTTDTEQNPLLSRAVTMKAEALRECLWAKGIEPGGVASPEDRGGVVAPPRAGDSPGRQQVIKITQREILDIIDWGVKHGRSLEDIQKDINSRNEALGGSGNVSRSSPGPTVVKIGDSEITHIVDWGIRNNRTPEDIQRDLDARNNTLGGSGTVQLPEKPVVIFTPFGRVTATKREAREYQEWNAQLSRVARIRERLGELDRDMDHWTPWLEKRKGLRALAGSADVLSQSINLQRMVRPYGQIDEKYGRPERNYIVGIPLDILEEQKSVQAEIRWQASENALLAAREKARAVREFREAMQMIGKTEGVPSDHPGLTALNRPILKLNEIIREQEALTGELEALDRSYSLSELLSKKLEFERRGLR